MAENWQALAAPAEVGCESDTAPEDFAELVRRHQAMVYSIAWHFLHDRGLAEEVAQEVFLRLHRELGALQSPSHVVLWLRRVTCHRALDCWRRRRREEISLEEAGELPSAPQEGDPLLEDRLRRLVASLPPKWRAMVILRYQEDLQPAEIAQVLNMPVGTVKSGLQRALATLREKIRRSMGGPEP
ncbi:MAG TPA: sigma-70 family RNA polymerase sigma factor [Bryobacteraceae bacterium]|nr:sigma-70 family RNA polymerase sigma factor [Bryobacteraceae bacterium]